MRCQKCGKKINKQQTVCPWCGEAQAEKTKDPKMVTLSAKGKKKRLTDKQKKWIIGICVTIGAVLLAAIVTVVTIVSSIFGGIQRESKLSQGEISINNELPAGEDVQNIALFGIDSRKDNDSGRSDALIILTIDRVHNKIKLTSIARDSLVAIEGYGESKITHAFAWGKAKLAVKTLNQNFGMNITDYAYINFFEFVKMVDYVGGVMIDVDAGELDIMNNYYGPEMRAIGFKYENVPSVGYQRLNGAQALAYSRNRYTGSDIHRGNRQKEVLQAMFEQVKTVPLTKYPTMIGNVLEMCHTTLTNTEMLEIATWAIRNSPTFETFSLPSPECKAVGGSYLHHGWVYRFDLPYATKVLHTFIYEESLGNDATVPIIMTTTKKNTSPATTTTTTATTTTTTTATGTSDTGTTESTEGSTTETETTSSTTDTTAQP